MVAQLQAQPHNLFALLGRIRTRTELDDSQLAMRIAETALSAHHNSSSLHAMYATLLLEQVLCVQSVREINLG